MIFWKKTHRQSLRKRIMGIFNEILQRVSIHDILADHGYRPQKRRMPCPIHGGKNPTAFSFTDDAFYCFSCGASGGLLDLAQTLRGSNRQEALKYLANLAGIPLTEFPAVTRRMPQIPHCSKSIGNDDADINGLRIEMKALDILYVHNAWRIRDTESRLAAGAFGLGEYYRRKQYCEYLLDMLVELKTKLHYDINMNKRGNKNAKISGRQ